MFLCRKHKNATKVKPAVSNETNTRAYTHYEGLESEYKEYFMDENRNKC